MWLIRVTSNRECPDDFVSGAQKIYVQLLLSVDAPGVAYVPSDAIGSYKARACLVKDYAQFGRLCKLVKCGDITRAGEYGLEGGDDVHVTNMVALP